MDPVTRTLIVGDSHVARLTEFVFNPPHEYEGRVNPQMGLDADVIFHGIGGRTTAKITERDLTVLSDIDPHVIVLLVGGNDLCAPEATSLQVASAIHDLAVTLAQLDRCQEVFVCAIPLREKCPRVTPSFNNRVQHCNNILGDLLEPEEMIDFFSLRGLYNSPTPLYIDGVHFSNKGLYKLYRSVRGAVMAGRRIMDRLRGGFPRNTPHHY